MATFDCLTINDLSPFTFIGGTSQSLAFDIYDTDGSLVDLSSANCGWVLSPYGNPNYATLTISGSIAISPVNRFTISVTGSMTQLLGGKYTHQPYIIDSNGKEFRPSQGLITIIPRNATV